MATSERRAWARVAQIATELRLRGDSDGAKKGAQLYELAAKMLTQLSSGVHENPRRRAARDVTPAKDAQPIIKYSAQVMRYTQQGLSLREAEERAAALLPKGHPWRANPPLEKVRRLSPRVVQMRYGKHYETGHQYQHDFGPGVEAWVIRRGGRRDVLLTHRNGKPLWEDM